MLVVRGAQYADCDGVYTMTNLSSVWDTKHIVYTRLGQQGRDQRWAHLHHQLDSVQGIYRVSDVVIKCILTNAICLVI